jgi:hypothetical protein
MAILWNEWPGRNLLSDLMHSLMSNRMLTFEPEDPAFFDHQRDHQSLVGAVKVFLSSHKILLIYTFVLFYSGRKSVILSQ